MKIILDPKEISAQALASPQVRAGLRDRAAIALPRAKREALAAGDPEFAASLHIVEGTRPGAKSPTGIRRPFARVMGDRDFVGPRRSGAAPSATKEVILRRAMRL